MVAFRVIVGVEGVSMLDRGGSRGKGASKAGLRVFFTAFISVFKSHRSLGIPRKPSVAQGIDALCSTWSWSRVIAVSGWHMFAIVASISVSARLYPEGGRIDDRSWLSLIPYIAVIRSRFF